jgi:hypothetical protein
MNNFKNRVSLTQKNRNLQKMIEELALNYKQREQFLEERSICDNKTSEICTGPIFMCGALVLFVLVAGVVAGFAVEASYLASEYLACWVEIKGVDWCLSDVYNVDYKNII